MENVIIHCYKISLETQLCLRLNLSITTITYIYRTVKITAVRYLLTFLPSMPGAGFSGELCTGLDVGGGPGECKGLAVTGVSPPEI